MWLYPTGWADVGYSPAEVAVKEVLEETGIDCEPEGVIAVLDGMRMGFTRIPLYSTGVPVPGHRRRPQGPPAGDERRRLVRRGRRCRPMTVGLSQWGAHAFAAIRGEPVPVLFDPPRSQPWHQS